MNFSKLNAEAKNEKLNSLVQLAKAYYFFFFSWGFFYWNAGTLTFKYKLGDCYTCA